MTTSAAPPVESRKRLLIFGDSRLTVSRFLLERFTLAARAHSEIELIGVCDTARVGPRGLRRSLRRAALRAFDRGHWELRAPSGSLAKIAQGLRLPSLTLDSGGVNGDGLRRALRERWAPDLGLSLGCLEVFQPPLLACFGTVVNLHDGLLPNYRGLDATAWSVYRGESVSGYSFHHMTAGIDAGPVLVTGWVPVTPGASLDDLKFAKFSAAAERAPEVISRLVARDPGKPQAGSGAYFSSRDGRRIRFVADPTTVTAAELEQRLHCFRRVDLWVAGRRWAVTRVAPRGRLRFRTADGRTLAIRRAESLPPLLYRAYRALEGAEAEG